MKSSWFRWKITPNLWSWKKRNLYRIGIRWIRTILSWFLSRWAKEPKASSSPKSQSPKLLKGSNSWATAATTKTQRLSWCRQRSRNCYLFRLQQQNSKNQSRRCQHHLKKNTQKNSQKLRWHPQSNRYKSENHPKAKSRQRKFQKWRQNRILWISRPKTKTRSEIEI